MYNRQQTVHLLPFPFELNDHINSFCFYDVKTSHIRKCKKIIDNMYKECIWPRTFQSFEDEHWWVCLTTPKNEERQFQGINCKWCGNFVLTHLSLFPNSVTCYC